MDVDTAQLAKEIGVRIRAARHARAWTLDRLAESARLSHRMLGDVERGVVNPSIGTLLRVSDALGVPLSELVDSPERDPLAVVRTGSGPVLWRGAGGGRATLLGSARSSLGLELWEWTLAPGEQKGSDPHRVGTREVLTVLDGTVAVAVGDRRAVLEAGDTVGLPGDEPHSYRAESATPARFVLAVAEPDARQGSAGRHDVERLTGDAESSIDVAGPSDSRNKSTSEPMRADRRRA